MQRPDFYICENGEKAVLPFAAAEYEARLGGLRAWLRAHQAALVARVGPMAMLGELMADAAGGCDAASADALQARYGDRVASIEGGPRALAQNIEDVRLCAALKAAQSASPGRASR